MKFLLGYNMKIIVLWRDKNFVEREGGVHFSWWRKTIQEMCGWWNFSKSLQLKPWKSVTFRSLFSQFTTKLRNMWKWLLLPIVESWNMLNLALQLMIFCIFTHILFNVNKSNFHFKGTSSIYFSLTMKISKSNNLSFFINFRGIQFRGVIMNLIEIPYTK